MYIIISDCHITVCLYTELDLFQPCSFFLPFPFFSRMWCGCVYLCWCGCVYLCWCVCVYRLRLTVGMGWQRSFCMRRSIPLNTLWSRCSPSHVGQGGRGVTSASSRGPERTGKRAREWQEQTHTQTSMYNLASFSSTVCFLPCGSDSAYFKIKQPLKVYFLCYATLLVCSLFPLCPSFHHQCPGAHTKRHITLPFPERTDHSQMKVQSDTGWIMSGCSLFYIIFQ